MLSNPESQHFVDTLLAWARANPRPMPWLEEDDPYRIWLSEIILQQTQVSQGIPYYHKFVEKYPTVVDLAAATEDEVLRDWQGLGYNTRARNMLLAARQVVKDYDGAFPATHDELLALSGIGPYTAAAIASFAFGARVAVMDSNVIRVLCRFLGLTDLPSKPSVREHLQAILSEMIALADPAAFNQALMNFGALVCTPRHPQCRDCPFSTDCVAFRGDLVHALPARAPKKTRRPRYLHYFVVSNQDGIVLRRRSGRDIWRGMYDFPAAETPGPGLLRRLQRKDFVSGVTSAPVAASAPIVRDQQVLTHQVVNGIFYAFAAPDLRAGRVSAEYLFVDYKNLENFALPKLVDCYLKANLIHL